MVTYTVYYIYTAYECLSVLYRIANKPFRKRLCLEQQDCSNVFFLFVFWFCYAQDFPSSSSTITHTHRHTQALSCCIFAVVSKVSGSYIFDCVNRNSATSLPRHHYESFVCGKEGTCCLFSRKTPTSTALIAI